MYDSRLLTAPQCARVNPITGPPVGPPQTDNPAFIKAMARSRRLSLRSALDLACGSGTLTARLAKVVPQVVGLDSSPAMLAEARSRYSGVAGVQFISGDFRGFQLGQEFDV